MNLQYRIDLLTRLGDYILSDNEEWLQVQDRASRENGWFIPSFLQQSIRAIGHQYLQKDALVQWVAAYPAAAVDHAPKTIGLIMAGNIPLVGMHDLICIWIAGHRARIKLSSKDAVLTTHLINKLIEWEPAAAGYLEIADMLKGCDAYIATGSNNSAGYFTFYFGKYPHIIRRNRSSAAVLDGSETTEELELLADDVYLYFGLGCRNVTKLYVPAGYDFVPLLQAFRKYNWLAEHHKFKNNYDYNLAILMLNKQLYMSNESLLLVENNSLFSPISQLHYETYTDRDALVADLQTHADIQCLVGHGFTGFGKSQQPGLADYADGVDTMAFLTTL